MSHYNVLFLCIGNSSRSIKAEAILNRRGAPIFTAYSARSLHQDRCDPKLCDRLNPRDSVRTGFGVNHGNSSPDRNLLISASYLQVCDNAAKVVCPVWPGQPIIARWGVPDPAAIEGTSEDIERAYKQAFAILNTRISPMLALRLSSMDSLAIKGEIDEMGEQ